MTDAIASRLGGARHSFSQADDIFQVRVSLIDIEPPIWRRVIVPKEVTLPRFHTILQPVMGWTDSHLHQFKVGDLRFGEPDDDSAPGPIDHSRVTLSQILPDTGSTCVYEYDFGASWEHLIEVEEELPVETVTGPLPRCVAGERACPPEDCGGPPGYADLLEAIRDPGHAEHAQYLEWVGPRFDPETFSLVAVNLGLSRWARPKSRPGGPPLRRGASPKRRI